MANNIDFTDINDMVALFNEKNEKEESDSLHSGFLNLDQLKGGWFKGEFSIVGGRPGMGKKGFILSIIRNLLHEQIPISLFTGNDVINEKFLSRVVSCITFRELPFNKDDIHKLLETADLSNIPFFLNIQPRMTLSYIRDNARVLVEKHGVRCIFIDSLQNIFNSEENGNQKEGMENVCHELKLIARDLNVPLIVTSDLNRAIEHREGIEGKEPQFSDLRGSGAIENEADSVLLIHRPSYYGIYCDERGNDLHEHEFVKVLKNKYGGIGKVLLKYCQSDGMVKDWLD